MGPDALDGRVGTPDPKPRISFHHRSPSTPVKPSGLSSVNGSPKKASAADQKALSVFKVIGTTATSHASFSLVGNSLAYTSGAGAVVSILCPESHSVLSQRFYCTPGKKVQLIQASVGTPSWFPDINNNQSPMASQAPPRDRNGYLLPMGQPMPFGPGAGPQDSASSGTGSTPSAKDKMKTASCTALSPDGTLLAVGETGHQPKVFVYSTAPDASPLPLAILNEHRFGVKILAFSPCGKYLASLGNANDGFLHVWYLSMKDGIAQLASSNRCISIVSDMQWIGPTKLVTVGVRHVRAWTVEAKPTTPTSTGGKAPSVEPRSVAVLPGRNFVLQEFSQSTFSAIAPLGENIGIISTDRGEIATIQDSDEGKLPIFSPRMVAGFNVSSLDVDVKERIVLVAGADGNVDQIGLETVFSSGPLKSRLPSQSSGLNVSSTLARAIRSWRENKALLLDGGRNIKILELSQTPVKEMDEIVNSFVTELRGIKAVEISDGPRFLAWSAEGTVSLLDSITGRPTFIKRFPSFDGGEVELTAATLSVSGEKLFTGNSLGVVSVLDMSSGQVKVEFQAHGSAVTGIEHMTGSGAVFQELLVSCSRDRMVQIFARTEGDKSNWSLFQTLDSHKANVTSARISRDMKTIISCSADRTIHIHRAVTNDDSSKTVFLLEKSIMLKTAPMGMILEPSRTESGLENIIVSADKNIWTYGSGGEVLACYRTVDASFDSTNLTNIALTTVNSRSYLAGFAADKSLRIYDHTMGTFLLSDWGHVEGIAGLAWAQNGAVLATAGNDGTILLWKFESLSQAQLGDHGSSAARALRISPTRKVLTKAELAKFQSPSAMPSSPPALSQLSPSPSILRRAPSPVSTGPAPLPRKPVVPSTMQRRRTVTPSKSVSDFRSRTGSSLSRKSMVVTRERANSTVTVAEAPSNTNSPSKIATAAAAAAGTASVFAPAELIDHISSHLGQFREQYRARPVKFNQAKVERLKNELLQTMRLLDGSIADRIKVNDLLELFGDRLVGVVHEKLSLETNTPSAAND